MNCVLVLDRKFGQKYGITLFCRSFFLIFLKSYSFIVHDAVHGKNTVSRETAFRVKGAFKGHRMSQMFQNVTHGTLRVQQQFQWFIYFT